jgi:hypothetical protein
MANEITYQNFYTKDINKLTLSDALELHYKLNPQFTRWNKYEDELLQKTMKSHDVCHVVFGCNTSLLGEFRVELFTAFGTNLSDSEYRKLVSNPKILGEPLDIVKRIGYFKVFTLMLLNWYELFRIPYISSKMKKKWAIFFEDNYMNKTIGEIREEFGFRLI